MREKNSFRILHNIAVLRNIGIVAMVVMMPIWCVAQDFIADVKMIHKTIASVNTVHIVLDNDFFETNSSSKPMRSQRIEIKKSPDYYYAHINGSDFYGSRTISVMINHAKKQILYTPAAFIKADDKLSNILAMPVDSLLKKQISSLQYKGNTGSVRHYNMYITDDNFSQVEYFIDTTVWMVKKQIAYSKNAEQSGISKTVTTYSVFDTKYVFGKAEFGIEKYIDFTNPKKPISKIPGYTLVINKTLDK